MSRGACAVVAAASSGIGLAAIQIANLVGAVPVAVTRTSAERAAVGDVSAASVIDAAEEDVVARLHAATVVRGARVVFDAVGGALSRSCCDRCRPATCGSRVRRSAPGADAVSAAEGAGPAADRAPLSDA